MTALKMEVRQDLFASKEMKLLECAFIIVNLAKFLL